LPALIFIINMSINQSSLIDRAASEYFRNPGNTIPDDFKKELLSNQYFKKDVQSLLDHVRTKWIPGNDFSTVRDGSTINDATGWKQELEAIVADKKDDPPVGDTQIRIPDRPVW
jgi:hypothetical protein